MCTGLRCFVEITKKYYYGVGPWLDLDEGARAVSTEYETLEREPHLAFLFRWQNRQ